MILDYLEKNAAQLQTKKNGNAKKKRILKNKDILLLEGKIKINLMLLNYQI
jgi:hypothetical protein